MTWRPGTLLARLFATGAALLLVLIGVGFLLPGTWTAHAEAVLPAPAERVLAHVDGPEGWRGWTPWPDSGLVLEGPSRGAGSAMIWESAELGDGRFQILSVDPPREVRYRVEVQGGTMVTKGTLLIDQVKGGTRVRWTESGDFGRNPLMGYLARAMPRMQGAQMKAGLDRLARLVAGAAPETSDTLAIP